MGRKDIISADIGEIRSNSDIHFVCQGKWSLFELLSYILDITGPCKAVITSFSISEEAIRALYREMENKRLESLTLVLDYTCRKNKLDLLFFANNVVSILHTTPIHAKIILLENENWKLIVMGSANLNVNPRWECGSIFTQPKTFKFFKLKLDSIIQNSIRYDING